MPQDTWTENIIRSSAAPGPLRIKIPCRFPVFLRPSSLASTSFLRSLWPFISAFPGHKPKTFSRQISAGPRHDLDSPQWNGVCLFDTSEISLYTDTCTFLSYLLSFIRVAGTIIQTLIQIQTPLYDNGWRTATAGYERMHDN